MSAAMDPIFCLEPAIQGSLDFSGGFCYGNALRSGLSQFFVLAALALFSKHRGWQAFVFFRYSPLAMH
jgi:hypothetical protein